MAGTIRGRNARVGHYEFVSTYLRALEAGIPIWPQLRLLGLNDHAIERRRWEMSQQGWMPYGQLTREDAPQVRAMLQAKLREHMALAAEKQAHEARVEYNKRHRAERGLVRRLQTHERAQERARAQQDERSSAPDQVKNAAPVLDVVFDGL